MTYLAKSNGDTIIEHSNKVKNVVLKLAEKILTLSLFNRYEKILTHAALLHDIGKLTDSFQRKLKDNESKSKSGKNYQHNEIGWAFLSKYYTGEYKDLLLYLIFWHHGVSNNILKENDELIIDTLSNVEIKRMSDYLISVIGEEFLANENTVLESEINDVPLYNEVNNTLFQWKVLYGCLVSGDRIGSSNYLNLNDELDKYMNLSNNYNPIKNWKYKGTKRSDEQIKIVNACRGTTMLNAPAGFGKTTMGLLWGLKRDKKIIWVCPRNTVADAVYNGVLSELKTMNINPTIELLLSGEIKKGGNGKMFESDIVITNIDNFLAPSNNNSLLKYYSLINSASVIFDEYHELITDNPLFASFIYIMKGRNLITNSETLLLSATPNLIHSLWESGFDSKMKTQILPELGKHFPAQHTTPFKLNVYTSNSFKLINNKESLVIYNSIANAQRNMFNGNYSELYHSKFTDEDRAKSLTNLLNNHGKNGASTDNIIGTHILQASLDISFKKVYESCLSPDSTLQRLGRNNRWGNMQNAEFTSVLLDNKSEKSLSNILYDKNLQNIWFEFLEKNNNTSLTLDEIYNLYNQFYLNNKILIKKRIKQILKTSKEALAKIYPTKFYNKNKTKTNVLSANGNKLRSSGNEVFYIVKNVSGGWSDAFSEQILGDFDKHFNEDGNVSAKMIKVMKQLRNDLDGRFDFNDILNGDKYGKGITLDEIRRHAKKSNTPYIRFDKVYDKKLGVISANLLENLKNV